MKSHKVAVVTKEREVAAREAALVEREARLVSVVSEKDHEIVRLRELLGQAEALSEQRLRDVRKRMEEVMALREEELEQHVRQRDQELFAWWTTREQEIRAGMMKELEDKVNWVRGREEELEAEQAKLDEARQDLEVRMKAVEENAANEAKGSGYVFHTFQLLIASTTGRKDKTPLEEVKNLLAPLAQMTQDSRLRSAQRRSHDVSFMNTTMTLETPINRPVKPAVPFSAMKGVILTNTGEPLATPTPAQFVKLFVKSPKVNIEFAKIFDFDEGAESSDAEGGEGDADLPPSPSKRERTSPEMTASASSSRDPNVVPPTRLRKPSIRGSVRRAPLRRTATLPASASDPTGFASSSRPSKSTTSRTECTDVCTTTKTAPPIPAEYDLSDEENLPSPFLKRIERERVIAPGKTKRSGTGNLLRVVAAANNAKQGKQPYAAGTMGHGTRPSLAGARKASEEARKALSRS